MALRSSETDYLVVGAGAMGMAFTDAMIDHADVHVTLVDPDGLTASCRLAEVVEPGLAGLTALAGDLKLLARLAQLARRLRAVCDYDRAR